MWNLDLKKKKKKDLKVEGGLFGRGRRPVVGESRDKRG
jgi:hypothetical protein